MSPLKLLVAGLWLWVVSLVVVPLIFGTPWSYLTCVSLLAATRYLFEDGVPWVFLHSTLWKMKNSLHGLSLKKQEHVRPWLLRGAPVLGNSMQRTVAGERNALYIKYRDALSKLTGTLPAFAPPSELLDSLIAAYESVLFAPSSPLEILEDYIDETLNCARLQKWLSRLDTANVSPLALTALHEMLFTVALIPSHAVRCSRQLHPSFPVSGDIQRFVFSLFSRQLVIKLIKEVTRNAKTGLRIILLSHINSDCLSAPPIRRWLMLSLMNYSLEVRQKTVKDPLWNALLNLSPERQVQWVTAASGHMEQFFLNTCKTCANNQGLLAHMPTAANGLILAEVVADVTSKSITLPSWAGVDAYEVTVGRPRSMEVYLQSQVHTTVASLKRLRARTSELLSAPSNSFFELFELTNDWSFVVQEMSVLWRPGLYLTAKPFADDWAASAKLMTLIAALIMFVPGQPLLSLRARGSPRSWKHPYRVLECTSNFVGNKDLAVFTHASWKLRNAPASDALINELWVAALRLGGVLVGSNDHLAGVTIGHLGFITAWRSPTCERVFLLSDPEYACYKLLSFDQMRYFISHPPHCTDFLVID